MHLHFQNTQNTSKAQLGLKLSEMNMVLCEKKKFMRSCSYTQYRSKRVVAMGVAQSDTYHGYLESYDLKKNEFGVSVLQEIRVLRIRFHAKSYCTTV